MIRPIHKLVHATQTMLIKGSVFITLLIVAWISSASYEAYGCTVCDSKKPTMGKMHEELGLQDCFKCH